MKKFISLSILALSVFFAIFLNSCKKDFTEEDAINLLDSLQTAQQNGGIIQYSVNVVSVGNSACQKSTKAEGATVAVAQNGIIVTKTTGPEGIVVFENMRIGNVAVNVQFADHTTADFVADLTPNSLAGQDFSGQTRYASTLVPMFPTTGTTMATISGKITVESNLVNTSREVAEGAHVIGVIDVASPEFLPYISPTGDAINTDCAGKIISIVFSNFGSIGTANSSGIYSLTMPATALGLPVILRIDDYVTDQSLLLNQLHGQNVFGVQIVRTTFSDLIIASTIPSVAGAYVTISAPTGTIGICDIPAMVTATIAAGLITGYTVAAPGSGYTAVPDIVINSADGSGAVATAVLDPITGGIISVNPVSPGSGYTAATVIAVISPYHQNAKAHTTITAAPNGNISSIILDVAGLGYIAPPTITIIPAVSGMGSSATAEYTVNPTGSLLGADILLTNGGGGYLGINSPSIAQDATFTPDGTYFEVYSGSTYVKDIYLGTGLREITW